MMLRKRLVAALLFPACAWAAGGSWRWDAGSLDSLKRLGGRAVGAVRFVPGKTGRAAKLARGAYAAFPAASWFDPAIGTLSLWARPGFRPGDGRRHTLVHIGERADLHFTIFVTESGDLRWTYRGDPVRFGAIQLSVRDWRPGEWRFIRICWRRDVQGDVWGRLTVGDERRDSSRLSAFKESPPTLYLGVRKRGDAWEGAIDEPRYAPRCDAFRPAGEAPAEFTVRVDKPGRVGRPAADMTTLWNARSNPLPFRMGDPTFQRLKAAGFKLIRLVAVSDTWLWGAAVSRGADGRLQLDFRDFDRLLDLARAAGAEPYVRIAYNVPSALRTNPKLAYSGPKDMREWRGMVEAIVRHCAARRVRPPYWVASLNEVDLGIRRAGGDFERFLELYAVSARAIKALMPSAKVGGPALARGPDMGPEGAESLRRFVQFCRRRRLPLDFICSHAYDRAAPAEYEAHVRAVRKVVESAWPGLKPEYIVDEWNIWSRDHRQDDEYAAAYLAAAQHYMRRAGAAHVGVVAFNSAFPVSASEQVIFRRRGAFSLRPRSVARFLPGEYACAGVRKPGVLAHPSRRAGVYGRYRVRVPSQTARFETFTGIGARHRKMDGVVFRVNVYADGRKTTVLDARQRTQPWVKRVADLSRWAGETVVVELIVFCNRNTIADWAVWGEPRVTAGGRAAFDFVRAVPRAETGLRIPAWRYTAETAGELPLIYGPVVTTPYFIFPMLAQLDGAALPVEGSGVEQGIAGDGTLGVIAARRGSKVAVLVWRFDPFSEKTRVVTLNLAGLRPAARRYERFLIDSAHTNPYRTYVVEKKPGAPGYNLESGRLEKVDSGAARGRGGKWECRFEMEPLSVSLLVAE